MKRAKWCLVLLLVSILFLVGGCGPTEEPPVVPVKPTGYPDVRIPIGEFPNRHEHIDVVMFTIVGEELTVALGSNPTTGYRWLVEAEISDETIVQQTSHKFVGPGIDKPPGTPGEEIWVFKALKRGTTIILLEYCRGWEGSRTPDSPFEGGRGAGLWTVTITATIK